jgi:hypothetical protein
MRAFGMEIHAINRRGASDEPTDWIATTDLLDETLRVADVLVVSAALTTAIVGLIGAREVGHTTVQHVAGYERRARSIAQLSRGNSPNLFTRCADYATFRSGIRSDGFQNGKCRLNRELMAVPRTGRKLGGSTSSDR